MTAVLMERPTTATYEWNHSCTSQCPNPCPASGRVGTPEVDTVEAPEMAAALR
jgi:hypothetical protein